MSLGCMLMWTFFADELVDRNFALRIFVICPTFGTLDFLTVPYVMFSAAAETFYPRDCVNLTRWLSLNPGGVLDYYVSEGIEQEWNLTYITGNHGGQLFICDSLDYSVDDEKYFRHRPAAARAERIFG